MVRQGNQKSKKSSNKTKSFSVIISFALTAIMILSSVDAYSQAIDDSFLYYEKWQDNSNITSEIINANSLSFSLNGSFKYFVDSQNKIFYCFFYVTETSISDNEYDARVLINFNSSGNSYLLSVNKDGICDTIEYLSQILKVKQSFSVDENNYATFIVAVDYSKITCESIDVDLYANGHKYIIKKNISLLENNDLTEEETTANHHSNNITHEGSHNIHPTEITSPVHSTNSQDYSNYHSTEEITYSHPTTKNEYENHGTNEHVTVTYSEQLNSTTICTTENIHKTTSTAEAITTMPTTGGVEAYTNPTPEAEQYAREIVTNPTTETQVSEVIGQYASQPQQDTQVKASHFSNKSKALFVSGGAIGSIAIIALLLSSLMKKSKDN